MLNLIWDYSTQYAQGAWFGPNIFKKIATTFSYLQICKMNENPKYLEFFCFKSFLMTCSFIDVKITVVKKLYRVRPDSRHMQYPPTLQWADSVPILVLLWAAWDLVLLKG